MTAQEIYDKVLFALRRQGRASGFNSGSCEEMCAYRSHDDCKCAVGHLIEDADYTDRMEGMRVASLIERFPKLNCLKEHVDLLTTLHPETAAEVYSIP